MHLLQTSYPSGSTNIPDMIKKCTKRLSVVAAFMFTVSTFAQTEYHCFDGGLTNRLRMEVCLVGISAQATTSDDIWYQFISISNSTPRIYIPKSAYLCNVSLIDPKGTNVSRTSLGRQFGAAFSEVSRLEWREIWNSIEKTKSGDAMQTFAGPQGGGRLRFHRCDELFEIHEAGEYTLRVQFQAFEEINLLDQQKRELRLVRFPPFEITIRKP